MMNKIDTNYTSLDEIDENIRSYYSEDVRTRITGYTEPDEAGESQPITEQYTIIVLNQPDTVTYADVDQRRGERKSWESVVKPELVRAIEWEEFNVHHHQYLDWKDRYATWEVEQPIQSVWDEATQTYIDEVVPAPEQPVIDMANRQAVYQVVTTDYDSNYAVFTGAYDEAHDDEALTLTRTPVVTAKPDSEIGAYHSALAIKARLSAVYGVIEHNGAEFDIDAGKDGIRGIDNFRSVIDEVLINPDAESTIVNWIAADNAVVPLTYEDVKSIVSKFNARQQAVFEQYAIWRAGDKLSPFSYLESE